MNESGVDIPRESDSALSEESEPDDITIALLSWFCREEDLRAVIDEAAFEGGSTSPELRVRLFALLPVALFLGGDGSAFLAFVTYLEVGEGESASEDVSGSSASISDAESREVVSESSDTMYFLRALGTRMPGLERGNASLESEAIEALARTVYCSLSPCLNFVEFDDFCT